MPPCYSWGESRVDGAHVAVPVAPDGVARHDLLQTREVGGRELHVGCGDVLLQVPHPLRAGDRDDASKIVHSALGEDPGEGELAGGAALLGRDLADLLDQPQVGLERLALEAREVRRRPAVTLLDRLPLLLAGEQAATERRVRDQADAELADRAED